MANLQYGNMSINYDTALAQTGTYTSITPNQVVITTNDGWKIVGFGEFIQSSGTITGGTITGYATYQPDGSLFSSISGINLPVSSYLSYSSTGNSAGLYSAIFSGNDTINGGGGNDTFLSSTGVDHYDGGAGIDAVTYAGTRTSYTVTKAADGTVTVSKPNAAGTDTLHNVERVDFFDGKAIAFDIEGPAGQAYRLYQAAFDRKPDAGGLGYWISAIDHGASLADVAAGFMNSPEFKNLYGATPSSADLVNHLYQNVLHRAPDAEGFSYWTGLLDSHKLAPMNVMTGFSESPENKAAVLGAITAGMEYNWFG